MYSHGTAPAPHLDPGKGKCRSCLSVDVFLWVLGMFHRPIYPAPRTDPPLTCPSSMLILIYTQLCRHSSASSPLLLHFRAMRSRASAVPLPLVPLSSPAPYILLNLLSANTQPVLVIDSHNTT